VRTAGAEVTARFIQRLEKPDLRTYVGKGKLEEIVAYVKEHETDLVVFDDDLQPSQVRNLEQALKTKILDRSLLILDIFSLRARTARARTQVELAQYEALLKKKLAKIDKQALTQRKNRDRMVRVTLVGYTNVGKSTLMRLLAKADVFAENKLFATVDSTVRKVVIGQIPFLLTDTVGFIRKLPQSGKPIYWCMWWTFPARPGKSNTRR